MLIVFDMDNTLVDELGSSKRPGIDALLSRLLSEKHTLYLWTSSTRDRAMSILRDHDLKKYFSKFIYRENYDPDNKGLNKDIRMVDGELLVDDDPKQIKYMNTIGRKGVLVTSYRQNMDIEDTGDIYKNIMSQRSIFSRLFK